MFKYLKQRHFRSQNAQTIIELIVFGAVALFILGLIIRQGVTANTQQDVQLKTLHMALAKARQENSDFGKDSYRRNFTSFMFIEDRLSPEASKFPGLHRVPYYGNASITYTKNLNRELHYGEDPPVIDMYINGKNFEFTNAGWKEIPSPATVWKRVVNVPGSEFGQCHDVRCSYDLDCDGSEDPAGPDVHWHWAEVKMVVGEVNPHEGKNIEADFDGDCHEERLVKFIDARGRTCEPGDCKEYDDDDMLPIRTIFLLDRGEGDISFAHGSNDRGVPGGLQQDMKFISVTEGIGSEVAEFIVSEGEEDRVRVAMTKYDLIERIIVLANPTTHIRDQAEAHGDCEGANKYVTCLGRWMDPEGVSRHALFVRSPLKVDYAPDAYVSPRAER